jgi:ACT domain
MTKSSPASRGTREEHNQNHGRGSRRDHRYELIELSVLFGTAAVADFLVDLLGHRTEGIGALACVSGLLIAVVFVHRAWNRHNTSPPQVAADPTPPEVGALWRIRTSVEDTPGRLAVLAGALAAAGANILTLQVHPTGAGAIDEFLVRTPPGTPADKLTAAVRAVGGGEPWAGPADVHALADPTAHALVLAHRLLSGAACAAADTGTRMDPSAQLPAVLAELLDTDEPAWRTDPADSDAPGGAEATDQGSDTLCLRIPGHGTLQLTRPGLPFTPAEYARARAMAELAVAPVFCDADSSGERP